MHYILYSGPTSETGQALKNILGINGGQKPPASAKIDTLLRWGSAVQVQKKPKKVINSRSAIARATDKLESLLLLAEATVPVPMVVLASDYRQIRPEFFPLLGRAKTHTQGKDIQLCMQRLDVLRAIKSGTVDFFTKYIPCTAEFRVHVADRGKTVLKVSEKFLTKPEEFKVSWIRNLANGFTFKPPSKFKDDDPIMKRVLESACRAVMTLGLDFGAVDILVGDDGQAYVLEVNTGPSLSEASLQVYVTHLAAMLGVTPKWPADMDPGTEEPLPPADELDSLNV